MKPFPVPTRPSRRTTRHVRIAVLVSSVLVFACGDDPPVRTLGGNGTNGSNGSNGANGSNGSNGGTGDPSLTNAALVEDGSRAYCDALQRCSQGVPLPGCEAVFETLLLDIVECATLSDAARGALRSCIDALPDASCGELEQGRQPPACLEFEALAGAAGCLEVEPRECEESFGGGRNQCRWEQVCPGAPPIAATCEDFGGFSTCVCEVGDEIFDVEVEGPTCSAGEDAPVLVAGACFRDG